MPACPNCGEQVEESERLCPACGFDTGESQADEVRELREEGRIHPGHEEGSGGWAGGDPERFSAEPESELPAEEGRLRPGDLDAGL